MLTEYNNIHQPLKIVLQKLVKTVMTPKEIQDNYKKLSQIKKYDKLQRQQLLQQNCFEPPQDESYESKSDSSDDDDERYKNLDKTQMKFLIRQRLIRQKMRTDVLEKVVLYDPELEFRTQDELQSDSVEEIGGIQGGQVSEGEKILNQVNKVYMEDIKGHKNLKALRFIIEELQKIEKEK